MRLPDLPDDLFTREELENTPTRWGKWWDEWAEDRAYDKFTTFENPGYNQMITVKDIPFYSVCSHHLAPFFGTAHVAYIPNGRICGLSKLARVVDKFAHKPQVQERLTEEIAAYLTEPITFEARNPLESRYEPIMPRLSPHVAVRIEARHLCMEMRGVGKVGNSTVTTALRGKFLDAKVRQEFMEAIK